MNQTDLVQPILQIDKLNKYYGNSIGCKNVSFEVWPGEVVGIVGESGSGKSTVMGCISGSLKTTSGSIIYDSEEYEKANLCEIPEAGIRKLIRK